MKTLYKNLGLLLYPLLLPIMRMVIKRTKRVYVIVVTDDGVLLIKNWLARDTWRLPGGGIGRNEPARTAAVRELNEELKIRINESELTPLGFGIHSTDKLGFSYEIYVYKSPKVSFKANRFEITEAKYFHDLPSAVQEESLQAIKLVKLKIS